MPRWLRHYLFDRDLRSHFRRAFLLGAAARALSAFFVYGPQALDDYKHGVWPAYQFFAGLPLTLPDYRSHLLIWFLSLPLEVAALFGANSALAQVRAIYFGLGAVSLLAVLGTYLFVKGFRSRIFPPLALYLVALFPLMPFVSTRAFGEAVAMSLVALAFGTLEHARRSPRAPLMLWTSGFAVLGLATLFRFHVGLMFVSYAAVLLYSKNRRGVAGAFIAGLMTLAGQALIDVASGKAPLATLFIYLGENEGGGAKYGVSPWYNPWLFVLGLSLAPFSFTLYRALPGLWRRYRQILIPFLIFVGAHSLAAHKEERFLYPILALELWALAYLWSASALKKWARRLFGPAFLGVSLLALPAVCLINTQEGEIEPPALSERRYGQVTYLDHESLFGRSRFQFYFLRPPSVLENVTPLDFNANRIDQTLIDRPTHRAVVLLTSDPETQTRLIALEDIRTIEARCLKVETSGSLIDRLLYGLNPKHNQRRRPTWYLTCERAVSAD